MGKRRNKGKLREDHRVTGESAKTQMIAKTSRVGGLSYKDAKRQALALGMPFEQAVLSDYFDLTSYINKSDAKPDPSRVVAYDEWMEQELLKLGYKKDDPMLAYELRYSYLGEDNPTTKKRSPAKDLGTKMGIPKKEKQPKARDSYGLYSGTKKSYTYELSAKGFPLERVIRRVQKKFPDANPKSIKQWRSAYLRDHAYQQS